MNSPPYKWENKKTKDHINSSVVKLNNSYYSLKQQSAEDFIRLFHSNFKHFFTELMQYLLHDIPTIAAILLQIRLFGFSGDLRMTTSPL